MEERKQHWEYVYKYKEDKEVSWYQEIPEASLKLINSLQINKDNSIIDVGGGNSNLVSSLCKQGFSNVSVLDISTNSLERTKVKLGKKSNEVQWIVTDILEFEPAQHYDLWHDRATFHFLTNQKDIKQYVNIVQKAINKHGYLIIATFSTTGPLKCSGLEVTQYDKEKLQFLFNESFELIKWFEEIHKTPFDSEQNFIYAVFKKR